MKKTEFRFFSDLAEHCHKRNKELGIKSQYGDPKPLRCFARFSNESWPGRSFSEDSRTYEFRSDEKRFVPGMAGGSVFADSVDGSDRNVRLDWYLGDWILESCWAIEE